MSRHVVQGTTVAGHISGVMPRAASAVSATALGTKPSVEGEIDAMCSAVRDFWRMEPDEVMRECSAYSARCTELYIHLHRVEGSDRQWRQLWRVPPRSSAQSLVRLQGAPHPRRVGVSLQMGR